MLGYLLGIFLVAEPFGGFGSGALLDPQTALSLDAATLSALSEGQVPSSESSQYPPAASFRTLPQIIERLELKHFIHLEGEARHEAIHKRVEAIETLIRQGQEFFARLNAQVVDLRTRQAQNSEDDLESEIRDLEETKVFRSPLGRVERNRQGEDFTLEVLPTRSQKVWFFSEAPPDPTLIANHHLRAGSHREDGKLGRDVVYVQLRKSLDPEGSVLEPKAFLYFPRARPVHQVFVPWLGAIPVPKHVAGIDTSLVLDPQGRRDAWHGILKDSSPLREENRADIYLNGVACTAFSGCVLLTTLMSKHGVMEGLVQFPQNSLALAIGLVTGSFSTLLARYKNFGSLRDRIHKNTWIPTFMANIAIYSVLHWNDGANPLFSAMAPLYFGRLYISAHLSAVTKSHLYEIIDMAKHAGRSDGSVAFLERFGWTVKRDRANRVMVGLALDALKIFDLVETLTFGGVSFSKFLVWSLAPVAGFAKLKYAEHIKFEHLEGKQKEWQEFKAKVGRLTGYTWTKDSTKAALFTAFAALAVAGHEGERAYAARGRKSRTVHTCLGRLRDLGLRGMSALRPPVANRAL